MSDLRQKRFSVNIFIFIVMTVLVAGGCQVDVFASPETGETVKQDRGTLKFIVRDRMSGELRPCRIYLRNDKNEYQRCEPLPFWIDHFTCEGIADLKLITGKYSYEIESGKEYSNAGGSVTIEKQIAQTVSVNLERIADLASDGWYAGDLHNHRTVQEMPLLMRAENIHIGYVPFYWGYHPWKRKEAQPGRKELLVELDGGRFLFQNAYEDERRDGTAMIFNIFETLDIPKPDNEMPPVITLIKKAMSIPGAWIHADRPYWWEYPTWLACGRIDSIEVINNNFWRHAFIDNEAWGRQRDMEKYPPPFGNALYTQDLYFHTLSSGFHIPPAAGSASGVPHTPFGYNRVYVQVDGKMTWDKWWDGLQAGRCFVTNGPLLRVKANENWPGHVFTVPAGGTVEVELEMDIASRDGICRVDIISNGQVVRTLSPDELKKNDGLGQLEFSESGWFLVRAMTDVTHTYRFAMTGPFYVEIGRQKNRISKTSAELFLDWVRDAKKNVKKSPPEKQAAIADYHRRAIRFWQKRLEEANTK